MSDAPAYNRERFDALCIKLDTCAIGVGAASEQARDASDFAKKLHVEALHASPIQWAYGDPLHELGALLETELERVSADPRSHADNESRCRAAVSAVRQALAARNRADALRVQVDRFAADLAPLRQLVAACRRHIGADEPVFPMGPVR